MPMVETSVAVAMPLHHREADQQPASIRAGNAITRVRSTITRTGARGNRRANPRHARALARQDRKPDGQHDAGQQAAGEQCRDRHAGYRSRWRSGPVTVRNGFGHRTGSWRAARPFHHRARPRFLHLRKQHRRDRGHVRRLRARDARDQQHRAQQHILTGRRAHGRPVQRGTPPSPCAISVISINWRRASRTAARPAGSANSCPRPYVRAAPAAGVVVVVSRYATVAMPEGEGDRHADQNRRSPAAPRRR